MKPLLSPRGIIRRFSPALGGGAAPQPADGVETRRSAWRAALKAPVPLGRMGNLEVRLACTPAEIRQAQALRYRVFYQEMSAIADVRTELSRRDADRFDAFCDHLLVLDHANLSRPLLRPRPEIVGTYRLLRQDVADRRGGFYTAGEYDIAPLVRSKPDARFLELGRSCVLEPYRNKRTIELLWQGIWAYVQTHRIDVMIGCASLQGTDPDRLALPLSYLHQVAAAPPEWSVRAHEDLRVEMQRLPPGAIDPKAALKRLPPLIKGYLRLGAHVGDGAVIDPQFGTTDVCIILRVSAIGARYLDYYAPDPNRRAA